MKKNILYLSLVFIFILILSAMNVNAVTFKQGEKADITVQCIFNGTICSTNSTCNLTINYPNNSIYISNQLMNRNNSYFNYTLSSSNTVGDYPCSSTCCDNGFCGTSGECSFDITPSGQKLDTGKSIIMVIGLVILLIVCLILFYFAIKTENLTIKIFSLGLSLIILIFSIGYALTVVNNTIPGFEGVTSIINVMYVLGIALLTVAGIGLVVWLIYISFTAFAKYRGFRD